MSIEDRWEEDAKWYREDAKKHSEKYIPKNDEEVVNTKQLQRRIKEMFQQLEVGQKVVKKNTKTIGRITGEGRAVYFVRVGDNEEQWMKTDTYPFEDRPEEKREQEMVSEFHRLFNYSQSARPAFLTSEEVFKRIVFIQEELIELLAASVSSKEEFAHLLDKMEEKRLEAISKEYPTTDEAERSSEIIKDYIDDKNSVSFYDVEELVAQRIVNQADALVDILYFTFGTGDNMGVDLFPLFKIVHQANLSKLDPETGKPIYNEFGKIMKSHSFTPPEPLLLEEVKRQIKEAEEK